MIISKGLVMHKHVKTNYEIERRFGVVMTPVKMKMKMVS